MSASAVWVRMRRMDTGEFCISVARRGSPTVAYL